MVSEKIWCQMCLRSKNLLRFRERDIHTLENHQIICKSDILEAAAKEYTGVVAKIIANRLWMGAIERLNVRLLKNP